jgi:hypothetical protein
MMRMMVAMLVKLGAGDAPAGVRDRRKKRAELEHLVYQAWRSRAVARHGRETVECVREVL